MNTELTVKCWGSSLNTDIPWLGNLAPAIGFLCCLRLFHPHAQWVCWRLDSQLRAFLLQPKSWLTETVCMTWKPQMIYSLIPYWKTSSPLYSENNICIDVFQWEPCRMEPRGQPDVGFGHWPPSSSATWSLGPPAMFLAFSSIRLTLGSFVSTRKIPQLKSENNSGRKDLQHKLHVWTLLKFASSTHCYSWGCFISLQKNWET